MESILRRLLLVPFLLLGPVALAADYSLSGPHGAGWTTVSVQRPQGGSFNARLVYPATSTGAGAPFEASAGPFPAISFGHGFVTAPSAYDSLLRHLATWGYLVIASESEQGFFPSHQGLANDMRACLDWLEQQHADPTSPYHGAVDTQAFGLSGHSMGGGASILAAAADGRVRALANLAANETSPSAIAAMAQVGVPVSLIAGSQDSITPLAANGAQMYANTAAPKLLPVIQGGFHCGFVDTPPFGGLGCDAGSISRAAQLAVTRRLLTAFFQLHLRGDQQAWPQVWGVLAFFDPAVTTTLDPGSRFLPLLRRTFAPAGSPISFPFDLISSAPVAEPWEFLVEGTPWPVTFEPPGVLLLDPGQVQSVTVTVQVPPGGAADGYQRIFFSARRVSDGASRALGLIGLGAL